jgi:Domain of unknown function (DUF4365)
LARKSRHNRRKRRTREHVLGDLGVNYVERQVLLRGWSVDRFTHDYGIDLFMSTYTDDGELENGRILMQIKATDHLRLLKDKTTFSIPLESRDLRYWLKEPAPVLLIVFDANSDVAYWLNVQEYFDKQQLIDLATVPGRVTVRIPVSNRLDEHALAHFAQLRDRTLDRLEKSAHHD